MLLSRVEPQAVGRAAPPVAGVRRELALPFGGKAPRLGGVRVELRSAVPSQMPSLGGVEPPPRHPAPRNNTAVIAAAISVVAHVVVLAWALHSIQPDKALAKDDTPPLVIEGVSVILLDEMPTKAPPAEPPLVEAAMVEDAPAAPKVVEDVPTRAEDSAQTVEALTAHVAALASSDAEDSPAAVPDAMAKPVADSSTGDAGSDGSRTAEPVVAETRLTPADDGTERATQTAAAEQVSTPEATTPAAPIEPETAAQIDSEPVEVLAEDLPANSAPATDLYLDSADTGEPAAEHARADAGASDAAQAETAIPTETEKIAPLEERAEPVVAPEDARAEQPKLKKPAVAKAAPERTRSPAVAAVRSPLFGLFGTGGTAEVERGGASTSSYRAQLAAHLRRFRSYPDAARGGSLAGTVRVSFTVNARGQVTRTRLTRSSGYAVLDHAAVGMVNRASPFPPIPSNLSLNSLSVDVPVRFDPR